MIVDLVHRVEVASIQRATALRTKIDKLLAEEDGCTTVQSSQARSLRDYKVIGVDTRTSQPFDELVEAEDAEDAQSKVIGSSKTKVVAEVREKLS